MSPIIAALLLDARVLGSPPGKVLRSNYKKGMKKEEAFRILAKHLEEGEVLFSHDDGWNAEIWGRGKIEKINGKEFMIPSERLTWQEGDDGGWRKREIDMERVKVIPNQ